MRRSPRGLRSTCAVAGLSLILATGSSCGTPSPSNPAAGGSSASEATGADASALPVLIEAENAAVYAYGVIGAHLRGQQRAQARTALTAHRRLRDGWIEAAQQAGEPVPPAAIAYDLPIQVTDPANARELAARIETSLIAVYESVGPIAAQAVTAAHRRLAEMAAPG